MNDYSFSHLLEGDSKVKKNRPKYNQIIDAAVIVIAGEWVPSSASF